MQVKAPSSPPLTQENDSDDDDIVMPAGPPPTTAKTSYKPAAHSFETVSAPVKYEHSDSVAKLPSEPEPETQPVYDPDIMKEGSPKLGSPVEESEPSTVIESKPQMRNFQKEAASFVPVSVLRRQRQKEHKR